MSLLEQEAVRMAAALDDYELVSVTDIGGSSESGHWLTIRDERFGLCYEIGSHADYWDFLGYFADGKQWPVKPCGPAFVRSVSDCDLGREEPRLEAWSVAR